MTSSTAPEFPDLRADVERERASRQAWATEALRLDIEVERLDAELAEARAEIRRLRGLAS